MKDLFPHLLGVLPADNFKLSAPFGDSFSKREGPCQTSHPLPRVVCIQYSCLKWGDLWRVMPSSEVKKLNFFLIPILLPSLPFLSLPQDISRALLSRPPSWSLFHREPNLWTFSFTSLYRTVKLFFEAHNTARMDVITVLWPLCSPVPVSVLAWRSYTVTLTSILSTSTGHRSTEKQWQ